MPYLTLQDVKNFAPQLRISASSKPSESEVENIIIRIENELDSYVKVMGYVTPITGPLSLAIIKGMMLDEIASQIIRQQSIGSGNPDTYGAGHLHNRYLERLKMLKDPNDPFSLPDADRGDLQEKLTGEGGSIASELGIEDDDFRFTRNMIF